MKPDKLEIEHRELGSSKRKTDGYLDEHEPHTSFFRLFNGCRQPNADRVTLLETLALLPAESRVNE